MREVEITNLKFASANAEKITNSERTEVMSRQVGKYQVRIDGEWISSNRAETLPVTNAATEEVAAAIASGSAEDLAKAADKARAAFE
jgi:hypothetical protein